MPSIPPKRKRTPPEDRFWDKVNICGPDDCWEWKAARYPSGYGMIGTTSGHATGAHQISYIFSNGPIPKGIIVRHKCDNPPCCNPKHLVLGTKADNSADMVERHRSTKGRSYKEFAIRGEQHYATKLTAELVTEIRHKYIRGKFGYRRLAHLYKVAIGSIVQIIKRESWTHIP